MGTSWSVFMYGAVAANEETMNTGDANTTGLSRSASGRMIQGLQRQLSQDWKKLLDAPASCPVCLDEYSVSEQFVFASCQHAFCRDCASQYLQHAIEEREAFPVVCPGFGCMVEVSQTDWELSGCSAAELAALEQWGLEHALMANDGSEMWRPCLGNDCSNGVFWSPDAGVQRWVCTGCNTVSCLACKAAWHENLSCAEYKLQSTESGPDDGLEGLISSGAVRSCPHCGVPTARTEGCNHIACKSCSGTWYWSDHAPAADGDTLYKANRPMSVGEKIRSLFLVGCSAGLLYYNVPKLLHYKSWWTDSDSVFASSQAIQMLAEATVRGIGLFQWPPLTTHGFVIPIFWGMCKGGFWCTDKLMWLGSMFVPSLLQGGWLAAWTAWTYETTKGIVQLAMGAMAMCFAVTEASYVVPNKIRQWRARSANNKSKHESSDTGNDHD